MNDETIFSYKEKISILEVSKLDASSNFKKAEGFLKDVVHNEEISKEDKAKLCGEAYEHLKITSEQLESLNQIYIEEYKKTAQFKNEYIDNLMKDVFDKDDVIYQYTPALDYTEKNGLSYMAVNRNKDGKMEKYFVSSKKDVIPYTECEKERNNTKASKEF